MNYIYNVSTTGPTKTIQQAINSIASELESNTPTRDIEINVDRGTYAGFTIPDSALFVLLGTAFRLTIKAAGNYFPIIDFNVSRENQTVGIDVGANNPNVTIEGFRIQYFAAGIRASVNSHNLVVNRCLVTNNRNTGIFIENCDESQVTQCVVLNGDYGIVGRLCKDLAIIHNTIFLNGQISTEPGVAVSGLWLEAALNYGSGVSDTGTLHIVGNIIWNTTGCCLTLFAEDLELGAIRSNYNNLVKGDENTLVCLEDKAFSSGGAEPRRQYATLLEWKETGHDIDSTSEDPLFVQSVKVSSSRNVKALDLNVLPVSPVLGKVPSFYINSAATALWLPSYVSSSTFSVDILRNNRTQNGTAIGANDKASTAGFFGQDIFTGPVDLGLEKDCAVDPLLNIILKKVNLIYPKVKYGYFYSHEREYYLYANKECRNLGELGVTSFYLPTNPVLTKPISLKVNGTTVLGTNNYEIRNNIFILYHIGLNIVSLEEELEIEYYSAKWENDGFVFTKTLQVFKIREGKTRYMLPSYYVPRGPVVITDDVSALSDPDTYSNREYRLEWDEIEQQTEILLANNTNKILNGQFDHYYENTPRYWSSTGAFVVSTDDFSKSAYGEYAGYIYNSGSMSQTVPMSSGASTLSWHVRNTGTLNYDIELLDHEYNKVGVNINGTCTGTTGWTRFYTTFNQVTDRDEPVEGIYPLENLGDNFVPRTVHNATIRFSAPNSTGMYLDGIQFEDTNNPTLYHRKQFLNELTVEFETTTGDYYIDRGQSLSPVRSAIVNGFYHIPEIAAEQYGGPSVLTVTTLHEFRWPDGRKRILPWARIKGQDKLRQVTVFNRIPQDKPEIISPVIIPAQLGDSRIRPSLPIVRQGDDKGVGVYLELVDTVGNPLNFNECVISVYSPNGYFPGWLHTTYFGLKEQLGQSIRQYTNNAGILNFVWIPPYKELGTYTDTVPEPTLQNVGNRISFIETSYPVNFDYHGNISIKKEDGSYLPVRAEQTVTKQFNPSYTKDTTKLTLDFPISPNSVSVIIGGIKYKEITFNRPIGNQFYVDYENAQIYLNGRLSDITVEYKPQYYYINENDPYKIYFYHDFVFGSYANTIAVSYDYVLTLECQIRNPGYNTTTVRKFDLIAQNDSVVSNRTINPIALDL